MSLRELLAEKGPEAPSTGTRRRRLYERFGVCDNPFPASNHSRNLPHLEGEADREIASRFKVFQRPPHLSQVMLLLGTQGVGKTNMLDWYERQFADYLGDSHGYAIIRYYPDPDPSFDMILHRIFEDLQQHNLLESLAKKLSELSDDEAETQIRQAEYTDFRTLLKFLRATEDERELTAAVALAIEWMTGMRLLNRHRDALGVRVRLETLEAKTRVLRDLVELTSSMGLLHGVFLLLDELEKLDQAVSKTSVVRFLLAIRALIDALPKNLFMMLAMTPSAMNRYFGFVPALAGRLQYRIPLEPLESLEEAQSLHDFYVSEAKAAARLEAQTGRWKSAGDEALVSQRDMQQIYNKLSTDAQRYASPGVSQRTFLHQLHNKAEEKLGKL